MMIVGNRWIDINWQQFSSTKLDAVAIEDRWKQDIDVPVQPLPHSLAGCRSSSLKSAQCFGQMLDDGCRLQMDAFALDENGNLTPARERQKLRCLVHSLLKAHVAEREWLTRQAQHQSDLVCWKRMR